MQHISTSNLLLLFSNAVTSRRELVNLFYTIFYRLALSVECFATHNSIFYRVALSVGCLAAHMILDLVSLTLYEAIELISVLREILFYLQLYLGTVNFYDLKPNITIILWVPISITLYNFYLIDCSLLPLSIVLSIRFAQTQLYTVMEVPEPSPKS